MKKMISVKFREIEEKDDEQLASIIRKNLQDHHLDIPGTAYYDKDLDHLSGYYRNKEGRYYCVVTDEEDHVIGGAGIAEVSFFANCAEMQKLYLDDHVKGQGLSYELIDRIEDIARDKGYKRIYLETHSYLDRALHVYQRCGYEEIQRPEAVVHSTMDRFFRKEL